MSQPPAALKSSSPTRTCRHPTLDGAVLSGVNLSGAVLSASVNLRGAGLKGAQFRSTSLPNANLSKADLTDADFTDADLRGATLIAAFLSGATLNGADSRRANKRSSKVERKMENILKPETLTLFLYFVVPGFITLQIYDVIVPSERRNFGESLIQLVSYSLITRGLLFWAFPIVDAIGMPSFRSANIPAYAAYIIVNGIFILLAFVVMPMLLALSVYALRVSGRRPINAVMRKLHLHAAVLDPAPTAWDKFFNIDEPCIIAFHTKDEGVIWGGFSTNSFASAHPAPNQVYVEQVLIVDPTTRQYKRVANSKGAIINLEECHYIEMFSQA